MSALHDLWEELFDVAPTPAEEAILGRLARCVDPADTSFLLCALVVRFLSETLLLDPGSPVNLAGRTGQALMDLNEKIARLEKRLGRFDDQLKVLGSSAFMTLDALHEARKFSEERKIPPPVLQLDPSTGSVYWQHTLAPNALKKFGLVAFAASLAGGMLMQLAGTF